MSSGEGSNSDGSAGGIREDRPGGALTGAYDNNPDSPTYGQRVGPTQATPNRTDLPGSTAADIALNPRSKKSTSTEKALAAAQIGIPGGILFAGLGRMLGMMGTKYNRENAPGPDAYGGDGGDSQQQQGKLAAAPVAVAAKKPIASVVSTKSTSPPASVSNAKLGTATPNRKITTRAPLSFSTGAFKTALGS